MLDHFFNQNPDFSKNQTFDNNQNHGLNHYNRNSSNLTINRPNIGMTQFWIALLFPIASALFILLFFPVKVFAIEEPLYPSQNFEAVVNQTNYQSSNEEQNHQSSNSVTHTAARAPTTENNFIGLKPKSSDTETDLPINTKLIEAITGVRHAIWYENQQVYKIFLPRDDLGVSIGGTRISSDMGLTSWIAFKPAGNEILAIGDLVMHENQVNPVLDELLASNIKVTGLNSQFLWDDPKVMFMHIEGEGDEKNLSLALAKVFVRLRENYGKSETNKRNFFSKIRPGRITLTQNSIETADRILGEKGFTSPDKQIYKFIFGRSTKLHTESLGQAMGVRSWAAFTGTDAEASVTGDLAVYETELQDVLKALRAANIQITGIQNRMMGEKPKIIFVHYWGTGTIENLANGLKSALDKTQYQRDSKPQASASQ